MKKALSILLSLLLVFGTVAFSLTAAAEETPAYAVGDHIQFGTYPQTQVEESEDLAAAAAAATWKSYGYYSGNNKYDGLMTPGDWMQFADFFCGGEKYRAVTFSSYRPSNTNEPCPSSDGYQYTNGYSTNTIYYFKYEPLEWRVLDPSTGYIMCEAVIDSQPYQNIMWHPDSGLGTDYYQGENSTVYANYYPSSSIRAWLNEDFYQTAFTGAQKAIIRTTGYSNEAEYGYESYGAEATNDKITMLSLNDIRNEDYGFVRGSDLYDLAGDPAKMTYGTDYAKCQGVFIHSNGNAEWMLRTPGGGAVFTNIVTTYTAVANYSYVNSAYIGTRPACCLSVLADNAEVSSLLNSNVVDWGYCGAAGNEESLTWVFTNDGTLTISGTGPMGAFRQNGHYVMIGVVGPTAKRVRKVIVEEGVTSLPEQAFIGVDRYLEEVILPASLETIGAWAFYHLEGLRSVTIPENSQLTTIGSAAFSGDSSLTSFRIPEGVTTIENGAFYQVPLTELTIPGSVTTIGNAAFDGGYSDEQAVFTTVTIPATVTSIGSNAFRKAVVIYGYAGSAAEAFAAENGNVFIALCPTEHQNAYEVPATEATEAAHGYTAGVFCPDCETWLSGHDVIHNALGEQRVIKEPTETEEGIVDIRCTVCGEWGRYTADPTGSQPDDNSGGFWAQIQSFFRGIIDWFLRLFKWLG